MNGLINNRIDSLICTGGFILSSLETEIQQIRAPGVRVAADLISEGMGQLAAEFFGSSGASKYGKKATKAWLAAQQNQQTSAITTRYHRQYQVWFQETCAFVSVVSVETSRLAAPGNSGVWLRKFRRAESFNKLDTRIRHVISQLEELRAHDLVLNSSLPKQLAVPARRVEFDPAQALHKLEETLRIFIERELSKTGVDWWEKRIPSDVRSKAEGRRRTRESVWPWYPPSSTNVMDYLDFSDYRKIVLEPMNWSQIFVDCFRNQSFVDSKLMELEPIRNDVAHSRALPEDATDKLRLYTKELARCISKAMLEL